MRELSLSVLIVNKLSLNIETVSSKDISIPTWMWEYLNVDFIVGLPHTRHQYDCTWVTIDRMTKLAHLISINVSYTARDYAMLYLRDIIRFHGVPLPIIFDRCTQFTSLYWMLFQKLLGTKVKLSKNFHPRIDGKA